MSKASEIMTTAEHIAIQLQKAHDVLNDICSNYFENTEQYEDLPSLAPRIEGLLNVIDDYLIDATGAASKIIDKSQSILADEDNEG